MPKLLPFDPAALDWKRLPCRPGEGLIADGRGGGLPLKYW